ncbi:MAG: hypothetical protein AAF907_03135, partial [Planctomycetota bacterium]
MRFARPNTGLVPPAIGLVCVAAGIASVVYASVSPDLRLRIELAGDPEAGGLRIVATDGLRVWGDPEAERPVAGDLLRSLGGRPVTGPVEFY